MHGITWYRKLDYYTVCCWQQLLQYAVPDDAAGRTNVHGVTGSRKPVFYTVHCDYMILSIFMVLRGTVNWIITLCCGQQLLPICTVARGGSTGTVNWIITLCAVGSSYYQYAR